MSRDISVFLVTALIIIVILTPFGFGRFFWKYISKILLLVLLAPYKLWKWLRERRVARVRRNNYELLGHYLALLGNHPELLQYLRRLIEKGMREKEFEHILKSNLDNLKNFEIERQRELVKAQLEQQHDFKKNGCRTTRAVDPVQSKPGANQVPREAPGKFISQA